MWHEALCSNSLRLEDTDLDVTCCRVRKLGSIYLISMICSCSNLNCVSSKTNFQIVRMFLTSQFKIYWCTLSQMQHYVNSPSDGLVVKVLDSQSRGSEFKIAGWLQGQLNLSSLRGRLNETGISWGLSGKT